MPFKNYSTTISAAKTVGEIQELLAAAGCDATWIRNEKGLPNVIEFEYKGSAYRFESQAVNVLKRLERQRVEGRYRSLEHATRVYWRCVKDWLEAQLALIDAGAVDLQEVFFAWEKLSNDQTFYQRRQMMKSLPMNQQDARNGGQS